MTLLVIQGRKHNYHERGEGGKLENLMNQWRNEHSFQDRLSHHLGFTKNDARADILYSSAE